MQVSPRRPRCGPEAYLAFLCICAVSLTGGSFCWQPQVPHTCCKEDTGRGHPGATTPREISRNALSFSPNTSRDKTQDNSSKYMCTLLGQYGLSCPSWLEENLIVHKQEGRVIIFRDSKCEFLLFKIFLYLIFKIFIPQYTLFLEELENIALSEEKTFFFLAFCCLENTLIILFSSKVYFACSVLPKLVQSRAFPWSIREQ